MDASLITSVRYRIASLYRNHPTVRQKHLSKIDSGIRATSLQDKH